MKVEEYVRHAAAGRDETIRAAGLPTMFTINHTFAPGVSDTPETRARSSAAALPLLRAVVEGVATSRSGDLDPDDVALRGRVLALLAASVKLPANLGPDDFLDLAKIASKVHDLVRQEVRATVDRLAPDAMRDPRIASDLLWRHVRSGGGAASVTVPVAVNVAPQTINVAPAEVNVTAVPGEVKVVASMPPRPPRTIEMKHEDGTKTIASEM